MRLKNAKENGISVIFLENGVHDEQGKEVVIDFPITIIGESKDGCIIIGGLEMNGKKEDNVNVKHLTISQSKGNGVTGYRGMSFHLFHLNIEKSEYSCVVVYDTKRNTMSNCQVSHSKVSGVLVNGGLITINGNSTSIHNNNTDGFDDAYDLDSINSFSSIHLVSPLTIESVSINNGSGGNYGGNGTIAVVNDKGTIIDTIQQATEDYSGNIFYFTVSLSQKHAGLTDEVVRYLEKFLGNKKRRDELHYEEAVDGEIQIEDCNGVVLKAEFANWMNYNEEQEVISYSEKIFPLENRRNWIISLTDYGFKVLTERKKQGEEQEKEEEMLKQKQKQRHNPYQRGDCDPWEGRDPNRY